MGIITGNIGDGEATTSALVVAGAVMLLTRLVSKSGSVAMIAFVGTVVTSSDNNRQILFDASPDSVPR